MKVLVTLKDFERRKRYGGIAHYYKALRPHLGENVHYFTIGKREGRQSVLDDLFRLVTDSFRFWRESRDCDLVNLNPSLGASGLMRDGLLLLMAKWRRKKVVVFFRGWSEKAAGAIDRHWRGVFYWIFGRADGMIVLSSEFKERIRRWGFRGPIWVETTTVGSDLVNAARRPKQRDRDRCNILFLARLERDKGIYTAIEAHEQLLRGGALTRLLVVGEGGESEGARDIVRRGGVPHVEFLGYRVGGEKIEAFRQADVYVFPSTHGEGMPNSVLEAMAFGLPVITTPVGGLPEFFENGKMGYWLLSPDPNALASALERLVADPGLRKKIGAYNVDYAQTHFAANRVAARLRGIWQKVGESSGDEAEGETWLRKFTEAAPEAVSSGGGGV